MRRNTIRSSRSKSAAPSRRNASSARRADAAGALPLRAALRRRDFRDLADRVAVRLEAKPRLLRHVEEAVLRIRQALVDLLAKLHREIVVLDQRAVRQAGLQVHVVEAPGAA